MRLLTLLSVCLTTVHQAIAGFPQPGAPTALSLPTTLPGGLRPVSTVPLPPTQNNASLSRVPRSADAAVGGDFWVTCPSFRMTQENDAPRKLCATCGDGQGNWVHSVLDLGQCIAEVADNLVVQENGQFDTRCAYCRMISERIPIMPDYHTMMCACNPDCRIWSYMDLGQLVWNDGGRLRCLDHVADPNADCPGVYRSCGHDNCLVCENWVCWTE